MSQNDLGIMAGYGFNRQQYLCLWTLHPLLNLQHRQVSKVTPTVF